MNTDKDKNRSERSLARTALPHHRTAGAREERTLTVGEKLFISVFSPGTARQGRCVSSVAEKRMRS